MDKIKIVCTSTGCLEYGPEKDHILEKIDIIRIHMNFMNKEYLEGIGFEPEEFYKIMEKVSDIKGNLPHTAIPTREEVGAVFEKAIKEGYKKMIVIALSSYLGGTWNFIRLVAQDYLDKIQIVVVDAKITCYNEGMLALKAQELVDAGKDIPEILQELEWIKERQEFLGVAGRLDYMILNGRLKGGKAFFGKLMSVCPIIHFSHEGVLEPLGSAVGITGALKKTQEVLLEIIGDRKSEDYVLLRGFTGTSLVERQLKLEEKTGIKTNHPDVIFSCVTGIHVGPWVVGYMYMPKRRADEALPEVPEYYYTQLGLQK